MWSESSGNAVDLPVPDPSADTAAQALRSYLGWTVREQTGATSKSAMFRALRGSVEASGITVLLRSVGTENCRGFSLPDPVAPLVFINKDYEHSSGRSFTLIHELAHLMRDDEQLCEAPSNALERWCDSVATSFLLPVSSLRQYLATKTWSGISSDDLDPVRLTANHFNVSWHVTVLRLRELGLADQSAVDAVFNGELAEQSGFSPNGYPMKQRRYDEFGATVTQAVESLAESKRISKLEALRRLRVTDSQYKELVNHARGASA